MKNTTLVIASVLKPVNDTRMYKKMANSLRQTYKYDINIVGFWAKNIPHDPDITFHPLFHFKRNALKRYCSSFKFFKKLLQLKPYILIVNTPDLLIVSGAYKILFGCRLFYDVQENYLFNHLYNPSFTKPLNKVVAATIRAVEELANPLIEQYFLAEKCYQEELTFTQNKATILENKASEAHNYTKTIQYGHKPHFKFIFTGTLAPSTGVVEAIRFTNNISKTISCELLVIGYSPSPRFAKKIKRLCAKYSHISLVGGDELVDHTSIMENAAQADFGLISYPFNASNHKRIPTKLYEYLSLNLPIILQNNPYWTIVTTPYNASLNIDFLLFNANNVINHIRHQPFYTSPVPPNLYNWKYQEGAFLAHFL